MKNCPKCSQELEATQSAPLIPSSRVKLCRVCGWPLEFSSLLDRIRREEANITEIHMLCNNAGADPVRWEVVRALEFLSEHSSYAFPEYEDADLAVISIVNDHFIFNFGQPGAHEQLFLQSKDESSP